MKKYILLLIAFGIAFSQTFAQEEKDTPVSSTFESGYLIDNQTVVVQDAKTLEFAIQHKFGNMDNGISDLFGIYSPGSNIRLGLDYVPVNNLQVGIGVTKKNMYTDLNAKWALLKQTEKNKIPISVTIYGVAAVDGRDISMLGIGKTNHSGERFSQFAMVFSDRLSYFSQIIVARKFTDWLSLQAAASFTHYNMIGRDDNHDLVGLHFNGRIKFSPQSSFIFNYDAPLNIKDISEQIDWTAPKQNLALGIEISTFTHTFQIFVSNVSGILPQDNMMWNQNNWKNQGIAIGFNITRLWMF